LREAIVWLLVPRSSVPLLVTALLALNALLAPPISLLVASIVVVPLEVLPVLVSVSAVPLVRPKPRLGLETPWPSPVSVSVPLNVVVAPPATVRTEPALPAKLLKLATSPEPASDEIVWL
jgi:hypothetical protein